MSSDRNLLFGILALQLNFIDRDALVAAMNAWVLDKQKPLGAILRVHGRLSNPHHELLEGLVEAHLRLHGDNPRQSLAALSSVTTAQEAVKEIADADVQASLAHVGAAERTTPHGDGRDLAGRRFRVLRPHARGGLGEVFVARDEELGREVALKEIQRERADDAGSRARFLVEAEITGGLEHPGIVPVYSLGTYGDGRPFYAMRFIKGDNLMEAIKRFHANTMASPSERNISFRELLKRFLDVCQAIAYAHARGVLHRDLKPGNVMLGPYGETLVVDWGLAKALGRTPTRSASEADEPTLRPSSGSGLAETQQGQAIGTPAYMSPEQATGRLDELGPATDVYSLGATLYVLLTGQAPFVGAVGDVLQKVERGDFPRPSKVKADVPKGLEAVCLKAMARRPGERYGFALDLAADVEHWLADEPLDAYRDPMSVRLLRVARRHRTAVAAAAVLLVTSVVGLAGGLWAVERESRQKEAARASEADARRQMRAALNALTEDVVQRLMGRQARLTAPDRAFLRKVEGFYEEFAQRRTDTEEGRAGIADGRRRLGDLRARLDENRAAEADYLAARDLFQRLAADFPARADYRRELALCHNNLGNLLRDTNRPREAEAAFRTACDLRQKLVDEFPDPPDFRRDLARSQHNLGYLLHLTGQPRGAEEALRSAQSHRRRLVAEFPDNPDDCRDLAKGQTNLSLVLFEARRLPEVEEAQGEARGLLRKLADEFPDVPEYRSLLAACHNNLGALMRDLNRPPKAEEDFRAALDLFQTLAEEYPTIAEYQNGLAGTLINLAILRHDRADAAATRALLEQARPHHLAALRANPRHPAYTQFFRNNLDILTENLFKQGDHSAASRAADDLARLGAKDGYAAAVIASRCVALAAKDGALPPNKRQELTRTYADQALSLLSQAVREGFTDVKRLRNDRALDAIRDRADFHKLLDDLDGPRETLPPPALK